MSELKTPYLDKEINRLKGHHLSQTGLERIQEYQSIKEALSDLQATKDKLEVVKFRLNEKTALEDGVRQLLKKAESEFQATKKELEHQKYLVDNGNKTMSKLTQDNKNLGYQLKEAQHELTQLRAALDSLGIRNEPK